MRNGAPSICQRDFGTIPHSVNTAASIHIQHNHAPSSIDIGSSNGRQASEIISSRGSSNVSALSHRPTKSSSENRGTGERARRTHVSRRRRSGEGSNSAGKVGTDIQTGVTNTSPIGQDGTFSPYIPPDIWYACQTHSGGCCPCSRNESFGNHRRTRKSGKELQDERDGVCWVPKGIWDQRELSTGCDKCGSVADW